MSPSVVPRGKPEVDPKHDYGETQAGLQRARRKGEPSMAKGTVYGSERALLRDARSGLQVIRLTHGPCISTNLYIEMCSFTSDDVYVIIRSQRYAGRDAPSDVFRAKTDGMELVQVTGGHDAGAGCVVVTPRDGQPVLSRRAGSQAGGDPFAQGGNGGRVARRRALHPGIPGDDGSHRSVAVLLGPAGKRVARGLVPGRCDKRRGRGHP